MFPLRNASILAVGAALTATVSMLLYAIPRGLDLTDESLSILFSQPDSPLHLSAIHSQVLFDVGHQILGLEWNIIGLRTCRLFLALSSGALLGAAVQRHRSENSALEGALIGATFGLLQYTGNGHVSGMTYNAILWFSATSIAALLLSLRPRTPLWRLVAMGVFGFAVWVCKFPAAVCLLFLSLLWIWFQVESKRDRLVATALLILTPALLTALLSSADHAISPLDFLSVLQQPSQGGHGSGNILVHSAIQAILTYGALIPAFAAGWHWKTTPRPMRFKLGSNGCSVWPSS